MDPIQVFHSLQSGFLPEEWAGAPDNSDVCPKMKWRQVSERLNEEESRWVQLCRNENVYANFVAWMMIESLHGKRVTRQSVENAVRLKHVPVDPWNYRCVWCDSIHLITIEESQLVFKCSDRWCCDKECIQKPECQIDGRYECGCYGWCICRCISKESAESGGSGRGSLTTCGDVEENPGPQDEFTKSLVEALGKLNVNVTITTKGDKAKPAVRARPNRRRTTTKGRGSLLTNGDVETNPGPTIQTEKVIIEPKPQRKKRQRRRQRRAPVVPNQMVPEGQIQIMGRNMIRRGKITVDTKSVPEYTKGFLERHLDPCGEYRTALDYGKCPDGTLPQSASGQFREVFTIRAPGTSETQISLTGQMWSLAIISPPLWRVCQILVADMNRAEVGDAALNAAMSHLNTFGDEDAEYPQWAETKVEGVYVSVVRWKALSGVSEPSTLGVSPLISDFRITGEGFTVSHNTPSLIDQGMAVVAQFNPNVEPRTLGLAIDDGLTTAQWAASIRVRFQSNDIAYGTVLPGVGAYPWTYNIVGTLPGDGASSNTSVIGTATADYTYGGSTIYSAGQQVRWAATRAGSTVTVRLQSNTEGVWSNTPLPQILVSTTGVAAMVEGFGLLGEVVEQLVRANIVTMPPITQEDLIQMTPKTVQFLLKDTRGFYVVKRVWQPVLNMTRASSYGPLRFIDQDTSLTSVSGGLGGIQDTFDANYGFAVCNLSSLPIVCAPYVKAIRSWEVVPSRGSSWGPFTTTTAPKDENAMMIARTVSDLDPFAYPHDYNGFGVLFAKVCSIISKIPRALRTGAAVADKVAQVCEGAQGIVSTISSARTRDRILTRAEML